MLRTLNATRAEFVPLRRSVSPIPRPSTGLRCDRGETATNYPVGATARRTTRRLSLTVRVRVRLARQCRERRAGAGRSMPASPAQSRAVSPSARNWSVCSLRRLMLVSCSTMSPSCSTLTVSPPAQRPHRSSDSTCRRRAATWSTMWLSCWRMSWRCSAVPVSSACVRAWWKCSTSAAVCRRVRSRCSVASWSCLTAASWSRRAARRRRMPLWSRWCWARAWRRHASS